MVELSYTLLDFVVGNGANIPLFSEVRSIMIVDVFVQYSLPGGVKMREVGPVPRIAGHTFMVGGLNVIHIGICVLPTLALDGDLLGKGRPGSVPHQTLVPRE